MTFCSTQKGERISNPSGLSPLGSSDGESRGGRRRAILEELRLDGEDRRNHQPVSVGSRDGIQNTRAAQDRGRGRKSTQIGARRDELEPAGGGVDRTVGNVGRVAGRVVRVDAGRVNADGGRAREGADAETYVSRRDLVGRRARARNRWAHERGIVGIASELQGDGSL